MNKLSFIIGILFSALSDSNLGLEYYNSHKRYRIS